MKRLGIDKSCEFRGYTIPDDMAGEFADPELSYRRGYQQGAYSVYGGLPPRLQDRYWECVLRTLHQWRLRGMREFHDHGKVTRPIPPAPDAE